MEGELAKIYARYLHKQEIKQKQETHAARRRQKLMQYMQGDLQGQISKKFELKNLQRKYNTQPARKREMGSLTIKKRMERLAKQNTSMTNAGQAHVLRRQSYEFRHAQRMRTQLESVQYFNAKLAEALQSNVDLEILYNLIIAAMKESRLGRNILLRDRVYTALVSTSTLMRFCGEVLLKLDDSCAQRFFTEKQAHNLIKRKAKLLSFRRQERARQASEKFIIPDRSREVSNDSEIGDKQPKN